MRMDQLHFEMMVDGAAYEIKVMRNANRQDYLLVAEYDHGTEIGALTGKGTDFFASLNELLGTIRASREKKML